MYATLIWLSGRFACGDFFGLPAWNKYINGGGCGRINVSDPGEFIGLAPLIGLAVLEMLLRAAGVVAVVYVIYGGFQYMISQGSPDATKAARDTIVNALVGMVIAIIAIAAVQYIGRTLGAR